MADLTTLLGALKGIWWPIAAVIIAVVYKGELRTLLPRLRRAGPTGVEFDPAEQQAVTATTAATSAPGQLREFPGMVRSPAIARLEQQLHTQLAALATPDTEKRDLLVRLLAQAQLEAAFERIYRPIFGSQIAALRKLNALGHNTLQDLKLIFDSYAAAYTEIYANSGFDQWLDFLQQTDLITVNQASTEITDLGRDFLQYILSKRLSEQKPG
jgi:hypothetical protein